MVQIRLAPSGPTEQVPELFEVCGEYVQSLCVFFLLGCVVRAFLGPLLVLSGLSAYSLIQGSCLARGEVRFCATVV